MEESGSVALVSEPAEIKGRGHRPLSGAAVSMINDLRAIVALAAQVRGSLSTWLGSSYLCGDRSTQRWSFPLLLSFSVYVRTGIRAGRIPRYACSERELHEVVDQ